MCTYYPALREVLVAADPVAGICTKGSCRRADTTLVVHIRPSGRHFVYLHRDQVAVIPTACLVADDGRVRERLG
jgi:hypothetical protein